MFSDVKAVIFDMDGVLVDSEDLHWECLFEVCKNHNINTDFVKRSEMMGTRTVLILQKILDWNGIKGNAQELAEEKELLFGQRIHKLKLFPGVKEALQKLHKSFPLALTTSTQAQAQQAIFEHFGLTGIFSEIVTGDQVKKSKPDPLPYLQTMKALGNDPSECVVIEDSHNGVASAKAAGAKVVGITHTLPRDKLSEADVVVDSLLEIQSLF